MRFLKKKKKKTKDEGGQICNGTTKKMPISDQKFLTDPKSPLKKSYL